MENHYSETCQKRRLKFRMPLLPWLPGPGISHACSPTCEVDDVLGAPEGTRRLLRQGRQGSERTRSYVGVAAAGRCLTNLITPVGPKVASNSQGVPRNNRDFQYKNLPRTGYLSTGFISENAIKSFEIGKSCERRIRVPSTDQPTPHAFHFQAS
jgi:hypothetical protein